MDPSEILAEISQAEDLVALIDKQARFLWLSEGWRRLGWEPTELVGTAYPDLLHPDDLASLAETRAAFALGERTHRVPERRLARRDGTWAVFDALVTLNPSQRVVLAFRAPVEPSTSQRPPPHHRLAERIGRTGFWTVDRQTRTLFWSPETFRIYGFEPGSVVPTRELVTELCHPDDRERLDATLDAVIRDLAPFETEFRIRRHDGEERFVQVLGVPQVAGSEVVALAGVTRDITDDDRRRRHVELEEFVHAVAHDLKQPARTLHSFLPLLLEDLELQGEKAIFADYLTAASGRLVKHLQALVALTRAGQHRAMESVDPTPIVRDVATDLGLASRTTIGELPRVRGSSLSVRQIFGHLLQNAAKYAHPDRPLAIRVSGRRDGDRVLLEVADNGVGFDPADSDSIFRPFVSLRSTPGGTGMGLAIVRRLIDQMRGRIEAHGRPGEGARFVLHLSRATTARGDLPD